jgi:hypothetical protein
MDHKEHNYPKDTNPEMRKVQLSAVGDTKKQTTDSGPHLKQGEGTKYNQAKLGQGFLTQNPRPGHSQKHNLED